MEAVDILKTLLGRNTMSKEEIQAAIARSLEHMHQIRPPEAPGAFIRVWRFKQEYEKEHPNATYLEVHQACMETHPEYWPRTLPQKPTHSQELTNYH